MENGRPGESWQEPDASVIRPLATPDADPRSEEGPDTDTWSEEGACGLGLPGRVGTRSFLPGYFLLHLTGGPSWKGRKGVWVQTSGRQPSQP